MKDTKLNVLKKKMFKLDGNVYTKQHALYLLYSDDKYCSKRSIMFVCYDKDALDLWLHNVQPDSWAYICHDADCDENGELKPKHWHCLAYMKAGIRPRTLVKCFADSNCFVESVHNRVSAFEYLTHKNDKDKHQYDIDDVVSFNKEGIAPLFTTQQEFEEQSMEVFLDDLEKLTLRQLAIKYGRDFMKNQKAYFQFMSLMRTEEGRFLDVNGGDVND